MCDYRPEYHCFRTDGYSSPPSGAKIRRRNARDGTVEVEDLGALRIEAVVADERDHGLRRQEFAVVEVRVDRAVAAPHPLVDHPALKLYRFAVALYPDSKPLAPSANNDGRHQ